MADVQAIFLRDAQLPRRCGVVYAKSEIGSPERNARTKILHSLLKHAKRPHFQSKDLQHLIDGNAEKML